MKRFFRSLWFIYGVTAFFVLVIICFPFYTLGFIVFKKKAVRPLIWCSHRIIAKLTLIVMGVRGKVHGKQHIDKQQTYIYVSNHQSSLDMLLNAITAPFLFKFLSKKEVLKIPLLGYIVSHFAIFVDRGNIASRTESFKNMRAALEEGFSVYFAPEGTRNRTDEVLTKFYDGAFRLAIETNTPLLVQTLVEPGVLNNPRYKLDLCPGTVHCHFDPPIDTQNMTIEDLPALKEQVRKMMLKHLVTG